MSKTISTQVPTKFNCTFVITNTGDVVIINHDAPEGFLDDYEPFLEALGSNLTDKPGAYRGVVEANVFMCNHPQDPTEWDINFTLLSFQELIFTELQVRDAIIRSLYNNPDFGIRDTPREEFLSYIKNIQNEIISEL